MTREALIPRSWVVVATLAVAPVLAQTPQPVWISTIPGLGGGGSPPKKRKLRPCKHCRGPAETREYADSLRCERLPCSRQVLREQWGKFLRNGFSERPVRIDPATKT
jgi:hypothetical protein